MSSPTPNPLSTERQGVPEWLTGLVDDAAIFPPGNAPLDVALTEHAQHKGSWYDAMVGPLLCSDRRLPELDDVLDKAAKGGSFPQDHDQREGLDIGIVVTGGAGAIEPALTWAERNEALAIKTVEIALRDEEDLAHNAQRIGTVLATALPGTATASIEVPRLGDASPTSGWLAALDEIAASGYRMKYRTGGEDPGAFPSDGELATVINAALDRELEFKCTAGLHHAVRHTAPDTALEQYREHHGFLNVLLATRAALDGAAAADIADQLGQRDTATVTGRLHALGETALASARRWFVSFGSCSIREPLGELTALGLVKE